MRYTVADLKKQLSTMPDDTEVLLSNNSEKVFQAAYERIVGGESKCFIRSIPEDHENIDLIFNGTPWANTDEV